MVDELVLEGVHAGYGTVQILFGVTVRAARGRITAVVGPNGSGKSTLARCAAGLLPVLGGRIVLGDHDITETSVAERVKLGLSFVPQERSLFPAMSVSENIILGSWRLRGTPRAREAIERVYQSFPQVREWAKLPAGVLSGGQQRIVEIARGMASEPTFLILDEPTAGVAPTQATRILTHLRHLVDERGVGVLLVEQNVRDAVAVSDRVYSLVNGRNDVDGPAEKIGADLEGLVRRWLSGSSSAR